MSLAVWTTERDGTDPLPLAAFAPVRNIRYSSVWSGGCDAFGCTLDLGVDDNPRVALEGRRLTVYQAGIPLWAGLLNEPKRAEPWTITAEGLATQAGYTQAIVNTGDLPYQVTQIVNYAITRGALVGWQPVSVTGLPVGPAYNLTTIADLLNLSAASNGLRWGVDALGNLNQPAVPTVPDLYVVGSVAPLGRTLDGFATHIAITYLNDSDPSGNTVSATVTSTFDPAVVARFGRVEARVDATKYGLMNQSEAQSVVGGAAALLGPRASFTGKVPLTARNLITAGGVPVHPSLVQAGQLVRFQGSQPGLTSGDVGRTNSIDVQLGSVEYDHDTETVVVSPVQTRPRDIAGVLNLVTAGERQQAYDLARA